MAWEVFEGAGPSASGDPKLSVRADSALYLNAAADREWFAEFEQATLLLDRDAVAIAIAPGDRGGQTYSLHRESGHGADMGSGAALRALGIDIDALTEAQRFALEWSDEIEAVVADLSALVDERDSTESAAVEAEPAEPEQSDTDHDTTALSTSEPDADTADEADDEAVEAAIETVEAADDQDDDEARADEDPDDGQGDAGGDAGDDREDTGTDADDDEDDPRAIVESWVREKVASGHEYLLEAREVADQVGLSGQRVGQHLRYLREEADDLDVEYERAAEHDEWDRGRWRFSLVDDSGVAEVEQRFGPDTHADDQDGDDEDAGQSRDVTDETYREVAQACSDIEAFARMFDDMSTVEALRIDRRLGLGLDGARYGGVRNGDGGESA